MDQAPLHELHELIRSESRSMLQYVSESFPWAPDSDRGTRDAIVHFAKTEAVALGRILRRLAKSHISMTQLGAYPLNYTTMNFVSVEYLLPRLVADQRARIHNMERIHASLPEGEPKQLVAALLAVKKRHLEQLQAFAPLAA
jgi:hypothetical protein